MQSARRSRFYLLGSVLALVSLSMHTARIAIHPECGLYGWRRHISLCGMGLGVRVSRFHRVSTWHGLLIRSCIANYHGPWQLLLSTTARLHATQRRKSKAAHTDPFHTRIFHKLADSSGFNVAWHVQVYDLIDQSEGFYTNKVHPEYRSHTALPFRWVAPQPACTALQY